MVYRVHNNIKFYEIPVQNIKKIPIFLFFLCIRLRIVIQSSNVTYHILTNAARIGHAGDVDLMHGVVRKVTGLAVDVVRVFRITIVILSANQRRS
jgi:hypothetical protein